MLSANRPVERILLSISPLQLVGLVALGGDDGGQSFLLEPVEQAADFGAHDPWVWQLAEQRFNGVQHDSPRSHPFDCVGNSNEEALEVILSGFPKLAPRDGHLIYEQFLVRHQPVKVEPQRSDILSQVRDRFLK